MNKAKKFEQMIARMHELLEEPGTEVIWNEHIPDPDNPKQGRQVDITLRDGETVTHVECRIHVEKQDVQWIEELIGRRVSLKADTLIGVSASGFTKGAILKAEAHGIILRDVHSLSVEEIKKWGKKSLAWIKFYEYQGVHIKFVFSKEYEATITNEIVQATMLNQPNMFYGILEDVAKEIDKLEAEFSGGRQAEMTARLNEPLNIKIVGVMPIAIEFLARTQVMKQELSVSAVYVYGHPKENALERNIFVEQFGLGNFEFMHATDEVSVTIDLAQLKIPTNCQYRSVDFLMGRAGKLKLKTMRMPNFSTEFENVWVGIAFE